MYLDYKRNKFEFTIWYVECGNMYSLAEVEKQNIEVVALQEIRWKGKGSIRKSKYTLYYSGNVDWQGKQGVCLIMSKKIKSVLGFLQFSEIIWTLRLKSVFHNITYTLWQNFMKKYKHLQWTSKHDVIITVGDFNAKLCKQDIYTRIC